MRIFFAENKKTHNFASEMIETNDYSFNLSIIFHYYGRKENDKEGNSC